MLARLVGGPGLRRAVECVRPRACIWPWASVRAGRNALAATGVGALDGTGSGTGAEGRARATGSAVLAAAVAGTGEALARLLGAARVGMAAARVGVCSGVGEHRGRGRGRSSGRRRVHSGRNGVFAAAPRSVAAGHGGARRISAGLGGGVVTRRAGHRRATHRRETTGRRVPGRPVGGRVSAGRRGVTTVPTRPETGGRREAGGAALNRHTADRRPGLVRAAVVGPVGVASHGGTVRVRAAAGDRAGDGAWDRSVGCGTAGGIGHGTGCGAAVGACVRSARSG